MDQKILVKNALSVVSCDSKDTVYDHVDILISGKKIVEISPNIDCHDAFKIDATGKFVYPGLVNTHHHFFQTFVRNLVTIDYPNMTVVEWLDKIYPIFEKIDADVIYYSSLTAMADSVKHGCTTVFDHQYCYTTHMKLEAIDRQMDAAEKIGIRFHAGRGTNTLPRSEGSTMPNGMLETTENYISDTRRLIQSYHDTTPFSMRQIVIAPCQAVNCYEDTFVESVKLAKETGVRLHTHLGEGENSIMMERWNLRTMDWCERIGFLGENTWLAHCWELTDDEYKHLGDIGTGISHCPVPAVLGGHPILDMNRLKKHNVLLSLGSDGSATNDCAHLLDSLRIAYLMQCYHSKERGGVSAYDLLKIATVNGAKTLGRTDIGSLEVGKAADLFIIDTQTLEMTGTLHDPRNLLARVGITGNVWLTMINGKVVYQDNQLTNVDEKRLATEGEMVCNKVLRKQCEAFQNLY